jgi:glycosyltransferase involved in cell wall biosynthesis
VRIAFLSHNARAGDAIGNQIAEKVAFFRERGADLRVFIEDDRHLHSGVRACSATLLPPHQAQGPAWDYLTSADLVFVEYSQYFALLDLLPPLARSRVRIVFDYHGITPAQLWGAHNREAIERGGRQRGLVWCCDAALVHSHFAANELRASTGYPHDRVVRLGHPLDPAWFTLRRVGRLRSRLGLDDAVILLFVGRLAPNKRVPVLIEAVSRLHSHTPAVHVLIVGDDADAYQSEAEACRRLAAEQGVVERLHFLGHVDDDTLREAFQAADLFVMPSLHEGFCIPVIEAMASGLPVIAARAAALPETAGSAGLTFTPDDSVDLARQVERVLTSSARGREARSGLRVAVAVNRFDDDQVGGAEASLRRMAETLHRNGHIVEVFTSFRANVRPFSNATDAPLVHRFPAQPGNPEGQARALSQLEFTQAEARSEAARAFLDHSSKTPTLLAELEQRLDHFDAILVGPYLSGLTYEVARRFPSKTVLVPCFHDERAARLEDFLRVYREVSGILYHSPEEQHLAEAELGVNHPNAVTVGTFVDVDVQGEAARGAQHVGTGRRYVVYCGRYAAEKGLPLLLDYARRYAAAHPERFTFVFMGDGAWPIPREPWACDLGFVEATKLRNVLAGAAVLVQLSQRESLSLAALDAWAEGVPVLAHADAAVLAGHIQRGQGGRLVRAYEDFATALDELWQEPERWHNLGRRGQAYVREHYGSEAVLLQRIEEIIRGLNEPLVDCMRRRGRQRAEGHRREHWREQFARHIEEWLHAPIRDCHEEVVVEPRCAERRVTAGTESVLLPIRVLNRGTHPVVADGPDRIVIRSCVLNAGGEPWDAPDITTPLPTLLMPGQALTVGVRLGVPGIVGAYQVALWAEHVAGSPAFPQLSAHVRLIVETAPVAAARLTHPQPAETVHSALAAAERLRHLPDDYLDVTQGWFAAWKRAVKRKLLNNFKRAYVDVALRRQSAFNQHVLTALQELSESFTALEHAFNQLGTENGERGMQQDDHSPLLEMLAESQRRHAALAERLARLEARLPQEEVSS